MSVEDDWSLEISMLNRVGQEDDGLVLWLVEYDATAKRGARARFKVLKTDEPKPAPTIRCRPLPNGQLRFFCPFCWVNHVHGPTEGHRVAHCSEGPLRVVGYRLSRVV